MKNEIPNNVSQPDPEKSIAIIPSNSEDPNEEGKGEDSKITSVLNQDS